MGYIRNECMVVSGWNANTVQKAHAAAVEIFGRWGSAEIVTPVLPHAINDGAAFAVLPDGSKEFWPESDKCDRARSELIDVIKKMDYLDWALILLGGDDGEYRVLASAADGADEDQSE